MVDKHFYIVIFQQHILFTICNGKITNTLINIVYLFFFVHFVPPPNFECIRSVCVCVFWKLPFIGNCQPIGFGRRVNVKWKTNAKIEPSISNIEINAIAFLMNELENWQDINGKYGIISLSRSSFSFYLLLSVSWFGSIRFGFLSVVVEAENDSLAKAFQIFDKYSKMKLVWIAYPHHHRPLEKSFWIIHLNLYVGLMHVWRKILCGRFHFFVPFHIPCTSFRHTHKHIHIPTFKIVSCKWCKTKHTIHRKERKRHR